MDGPPAQDHVVKGFFKGPHRQVHRAHRKQRQSVDANHDRDENEIQNYLCKKTRLDVSNTKGRNKKLD